MNNFHPSEFKCRCGNCSKGFKDMRSETLTKLQGAREIAGIPFVVASAVRCTQHNNIVGGSPTSSHLKGCAVDIFAQTSEQRYKITEGAIKAGFQRIGVGRQFVHLDTDESKPKELLWLY